MQRTYLTRNKFHSSLQHVQSANDFRLGELSAVRNPCRHIRLRMLLPTVHTSHRMQATTGSYHRAVPPTYRRTAPQPPLDKACTITKAEGVTGFPDLPLYKVTQPLTHPRSACFTGKICTIGTCEPNSGPNGQNHWYTTCSSTNFRRGTYLDLPHVSNSRGDFAASFHGHRSRALFPLSLSSLVDLWLR